MAAVVVGERRDPTQRARARGVAVHCMVFGREKTFKDLVTKLVKEVKTSLKGDCLTSIGGIFPTQMPPDIVGKFLLCNMHIYDEYL